MLCWFYLGYLIFYYWTGKNIIWIKGSYHIYDLHIFFPTPWIVILLSQQCPLKDKIFSFDEVYNLSILFCYFCFWFCIRKTTLIDSHKFIPMLSFELYSSIILRSMIWVNFCVWYEDGRTSVFCLWLSSCASTMGWKTILSTTEFSWHTLNWQ